MKARRFVIALVVLAVLPAGAWATNGMNMEGYGPVACGLGGASLAYDNGTAAVMNNPATLALMRGGFSRLDIAAGILGPDVRASVLTPGGFIATDSEANLFFMPAAGFVRKSGQLTYGIAAFAQGGMGTEFGADSWMADPSRGANTALTGGLVNRSEVSVGRLLLPIVFDLSDKLSVGGSMDFVWAGMDIQMAMSETQFQDLVTSQTIGTASGTLVQGFGQMYEPFGGTGVSTLHHAYFDFSNDNAFTGEARGYGLAGKLGAVYEVNEALSFGATYHSKTSLSDLETSNATVSMGLNIDTGIAQGQLPSGQYMDVVIPVSGDLKVRNFEWPSTYGIGVAYRPNDRALIALDVKQINWAAVMDRFTMSFEADATAENGMFGGATLDAVLFQDWDDQVVVSLGGQYLVTRALTLRAGLNLSDNPIPESYLNALFPAIVEDHVSFGVGYQVGPVSELNFSIFKAFNSEFTNPGDGATIPSVTSSHDQLNLSLMFSQGF